LEWKAYEGTLNENLQLFEEWLISRNRDGRRVILFCDEAQDINLETLDNLCLFSRFEAGQQKLLQIVVAGRQTYWPSFTESGRNWNGEAINRFCRLVPLDEPEVGAMSCIACGLPLQPAAIQFRGAVDYRSLFTGIP